ncbi:MAG: c-type cytochrome biogenesis protein CcmI [Burkholderiales bacterium]|nr:c-type cytochrome biogenesis protein CcmI [Burkholderiales bacterium]
MAIYLFIGVIILMMLLVVVLVGPRLFSAPDIWSVVDRRDANLAIYRDEMERLNLAKRAGEISDTEYTQAKTDLSRRLMAEIHPSDAQFYTTELSPPVRGVGFAVLGVIPVIALGIYGYLGNIQTLQLTANSLSLSVFDDEMMPSMSAYLEKHPDDARAWILLARSEMNANRYQEAAVALERAMNASDKVRSDPAILCELAEAIGMTQGGVLRGRPEELVHKALSIAPDFPVALEMAGSAAYEVEDYAKTLHYWRILLSKMDAQTEAYRQLSVAISYVQAKSGIYDQPNNPSPPLMEKK